MTAPQAGGLEVIEIDTEASFDQTISSLPATALSVIYFHAPWAEPCKQMSTVISTLASTYQQTTPPQISFLSLDAEEVSEVSEKYDVTQVPFIVLARDRQVLETIAGGDASRVRSAVEKHAASSGNSSSTSSTFLPPLQKVTKPPPQPSTSKLNNDGQGSIQDSPPLASSTTAAKKTNGTSNMASYAPSPSDPKTAPEYSSGSSGDAAQQKEALHKRLSELVKAAPVMLFMKGTPSSPQCGFSRQTVSILREKGIRYGFFNILADDDVRQGLKEFSEWPTFPQVYVGGELVGGLDIVSFLLSLFPPLTRQTSSM